VFLPGLPLRVDQALAGLGADATGDLFSTRGDALVVRASVTLREAELIAPGDPARIVPDDRDLEVRGTVSAIADEPGTDGFDAQHVAVRVTPEALPPGLEDAAVRVAFPVESTQGEVLAVPIAAVSAGPDGTSRVTVERGRGTADVAVTVGLAAQGMIEVRPHGNGLELGDRVVVGR
jgi:hypothetical protein